jgi:hypothetical protein
MISHSSPVPRPRSRQTAFFFLLFLGALFLPAVAGADELADFNAAVENASAHNRVAIGYLRTGNTDLASLEIDRTREAWRVVVATHGKPPAAFKDRTRYTTVLTDVSVQLVTADLMLNSGRPANAAQALGAIRAELSNLRQSAGIELLPDCVLKANGVMDELMAYDDRTLNFAKADDLADKAKRYSALLDRCDSLASARVRKEPEFRRLIDGAKASLTLIPKAIAEKDAGLVHRVLDELRSFDNLLAFRFG